MSVAIKYDVTIKGIDGLGASIAVSSLPKAYQFIYNWQIEAKARGVLQDGDSFTIIVRRN